MPKQALGKVKTLQVGFRFSPGLLQSIDAICGRDGITRTEAIRRSVAFYCKAQGIKTPETTPVIRGRPATIGK